MHNPRSIKSIRCFRVAAFLLFGNYLLASIAVAVLAQSLLFKNQERIMLGIGLVILSLIVVVVQWTVASKTSCPLCRTPVLAPKACMKHRRARTSMGSHRLRVSLAILFMNRFRCQYCNESTAMSLRETLRGSPEKRLLRRNHRSL